MSGLTPPARDEAEIPSKAGSPLRGLFWIAGGLLLAGSVYLVIPVVARAIPWSAEEKIFKLLPGSGNDDTCAPASPSIEAAFLKLLRRLHPVRSDDAALPLKVVISRCPEVNAYALPGARIFVCEGLLKQAQSPEELAGIIAHEIGHVRLRHITERLIWEGLIDLAVGSVSGDRSHKTGTTLLNLQFSRAQESEADEEALLRLRDSRISVTGFKNFFFRMQGLPDLASVLADHPASASRMEMVAKYEGAPSEPLLAADEWAALKSICNR